MIALPRIAIRIAAVGLGLTWSGLAAAEEIVWWAPNWGQARAEALAKRFEAANPGTTIKLEITVADGLQNRVLVALRSNSPPDLIETNNSWNVPFAATGRLMALDDYVAKSKMDLKDFMPAPMATATFEGKLYGLPYRMETHGFIYNKGLYRDAGLDPNRPPETWSDLVAYSKRLTRVDGSGKQLYGIGVSGGGEVGNLIFRLMPLIWANGGSVLSEDGKKAVIDQPAAVAAVDFYTGMFTREGVAPPSTLQNDGLAMRRLYSAGSLAQYQSGQYDLPVIKAENAKIEIGVAKLPHPDGKDPAVVLGGWNFIMPKAAKHPDATWKLMEFLTQAEQMGFYTDTFPARRSAMTLPRFQDPELKSFQDMLAYARPAPSVAAWVQVVQIVFERVQQVLLKSATPQEAMTAAAKQIQPLLQQ
ncbi:MAG: ABC transporter substrate-binding protein [Proteobacteria bacterium]|nr:ABC transporter substrate-binding protein [Pseudomonadota bacterium]